LSQNNVPVPILLSISRFEIRRPRPRRACPQTPPENVKDVPAWCVPGALRDRRRRDRPGDRVRHVRGRNHPTRSRVSTLVNNVRELAGRTVAFILIHHENNGGTVSGAWEGVGDTLLHLQAQVHGQTRVFIQKSRWASVYQKTTLELAWPAETSPRAPHEQVSAKLRPTPRPSLGSAQAAEA
jgi:hypothetical protein